jgi:hypothetical protein
MINLWIYFYTLQYPSLKSLNLEFFKYEISLLTFNNIKGLKVRRMNYPLTAGAVKATGNTSPEAKSNGKLCALRSCITPYLNQHG